MVYTQGLFGTVVIGTLLFQLPAARFPHHPGKIIGGPPLFILDRWLTQDPWTIAVLESWIRRCEIQVNNTRHQLQPCQILLSFNEFWNSKKEDIPRHEMVYLSYYVDTVHTISMIQCYSTQNQKYISSNVRSFFQLFPPIHHAKWMNINVKLRGPFPDEIRSLWPD